MPLLATSALAGDSALVDLPTEAPNREGGTWRVGAGSMWRNIGSLSVNPGLGNGGMGTPFFLAPTGAGVANVNGDRSYDDGFVNIGAATALTGQTTNWGYNNAGQISGNALQLSLAGGSQVSLPGGLRSDDEEFEAAPYLEVAYLKNLKPNLRAGFVANLSFTGLNRSAQGAVGFSDVTLTDSFNLGSVIAPLPPYSGSFNGPGPLIGNQPDQRNFATVPTGTGAYSFSTDTDLYSLALGGEVEWLVSERWFVSAGAGAVINLANWDGSWSVPVAGGGSLSASDSGTSVLWGLYAQAGVGYRISQNWSVNSFLRYDLNESLDAGVGNADFELDLSGWSIGLGANYSF